MPPQAAAEPSFLSRDVLQSRAATRVQSKPAASRKMSHWPNDGKTHVQTTVASEPKRVAISNCGLGSLSGPSRPAPRRCCRGPKLLAPELAGDKRHRKGGKLGQTQRQTRRRMRQAYYDDDDDDAPYPRSSSALGAVRCSSRTAAAAASRFT
eukprot:4016297-Pyramimonas_sp.AAC.1